VDLRLIPCCPLLPSCNLELEEARVLFNPFPGLRPFEAEDDSVFFGREKEIDALLERLRLCRFLAIVGTSGSGKSSLVRCGLVPSLFSGFMVSAGSSWRVATMRPGEDPIHHLAAALDTIEVLGTEGELAGTNRVVIEATLRRGTRGLVETIRQARIPSEDNLLIVVDQFEELFRFRANRHAKNSGDEAVAFVKLLLEAAQQAQLPIYVVLTMRSDFIGDCMEFPGLPETINAGLYLVPRMTRDEVHSAITGPVAVGGGNITQRLVLRLLNDFGDESDQLPVLQHALMRTWDFWARHRQSAGAIDIEDYQAIGTLKNALSIHAEESYEEVCKDHNQKIVERMFKALTDTFSDPRGVRRPTSVQNLAAICEVSEDEVIEIIEIFRGPTCCFLMPPCPVSLDSQSVIDLSHESLMRCWIRLAGWAQEEQASAGVYIRLAQAASWSAQGTAGLWRNPELELGLRWRRENRPTPAWAERYNSSFTQSMEFLDRSEKERDRLLSDQERERKRKLRQTQWVAAILGVLCVVALSLAYVAWTEKRRAEDNLQLARNAVDESLSSAGREQSREAADLPEMEEFRKELLDKAGGFYALFTKQNSKNEGLRSEAAWAHSRLGDISRLLRNHGDAVKEYRDAIARFVSLSRDYPGNSEYLRAQAYAHNWLGETLRIWLKESQGPVPYSYSDAEKEYDEALGLQQRIHDENPANSGYQQELARTLYNRGILRYDSKNAQGAESDFRAAISLLEALSGNSTPTANARSNREPTQDLARAYNNLAILLSRTNQTAEAEKFYQQGIDLAENLYSKHHDNREYKLELAKYCNNLAILLVAENKLDLAKQRNHQAVDLIEELIAPAPSLSLELVKGLQLHTEILEAQGSKEAQQQFDLLFEILRRLNNSQGSQGHPALHIIYMNLGINYIKLADQNLKAGDVKGANVALGKLSQILPQLSGEDREALTKSYRELQEDVQRKLAKRRQKD
jgi:tetratricopeptide (TPR) repeat protein